MKELQAEAEAKQKSNDKNISKLLWNIRNGKRAEKVQSEKFHLGMNNENKRMVEFIQSHGVFAQM